MMKSMFLTFLLVACGDNIKPPDGDFDFTDVAPEPNGVKPDDEIAQDAGFDVPADADAPDTSDSGVTPDAEAPPDAPACADSHIELNGHEHKCQHDMDLP